MREFSFCEVMMQVDRITNRMNFSGGGGNFLLSTSTLGYSITNGFVAPMLKDGYGVFYTMTNET